MAVVRRIIRIYLNRREVGTAGKDVTRVRIGRVGFTDDGYTAGNGDRRERGTPSKRVGSDADYTVRQRDRREGRTSPERAWCDVSQAVRNDDGGKGWTTVERLVLDAGHAAV